MLALLISARDRVSDRAWQSSDRGATAIEYSIMAGFVAAVVVVAVAAVGTETLALFASLPEAMAAVGAVPGP